MRATLQSSDGKAHEIDLGPTIQIGAVVGWYRNGRIIQDWGPGPLGIMWLFGDKLVHFLEVTGRAKNRRAAERLVERFTSSKRWKDGRVEKSFARWLLHEIDPRRGKPPAGVPTDEIVRQFAQLKPHARTLRQRLIKIARRRYENGLSVDRAAIWQALLQDASSRGMKLSVAGTLSPYHFEEWLRIGVEGANTGMDLIERVYGKGAVELIPPIDPDVGVVAAHFKAVSEIAHALTGEALGMSGATVRNRKRRGAGRGVQKASITL